MEFQEPDKGTSFNIPDEWWDFAETSSFSSKGGGYYPCSDADGIIIVELA